MSTARLESTSSPPAPYDHQAAERGARRLWWWMAVGFVVAAALVLRLWGSRQGLPFAYNADEAGHFVPRAIAFFQLGDLNPHYFDNPPAYSYLLWLVFRIWFGGRAAVSHTFATNPGEVFLVARVISALLGTAAVWLLYLVGARLVDRRVGLLAAALMAVAFLPVFYAHLALNDVPTLAPLTLSLLGSAGVLRYGRPIDYLLAGLGLGLACATKYTGGVVLVALLGATAAQYAAPGGRRIAIAGIVIAGLAAIGAFVATNPYALIDLSSFRHDLGHQSAGADAGKLGASQKSGIVYYLWSLTWGLGWVPALAALAGAATLWRDERRLVAVLVPAPLIFIVFMGIQGRYFGRWVIPILPIVCLLAAYAAFELVDWISLRRPALRPSLVVLAAAGLCVQGLVHSVHSGLILSRADTRNLTRDWLVAHVPLGSKIVVEPVVPDQWSYDTGHPSPLTASGARWIKFPSERTQIDNAGALHAGAGQIVNVQDYERTLRPELLRLYEHGGYCYVVKGSTQSGRADADPGQVPSALAYYRALAGQGQMVFQASPFGSGQPPVPFNFDFTFDYYPLAYHRPGPVMTVYRLSGDRCPSS